MLLILSSVHSVSSLQFLVPVPWTTSRSTMDLVLPIFPSDILLMAPTSSGRLSMEELVQLLWWCFGLHSMEDNSRTLHLQIRQLKSNERGRFILFQKLACIINLQSDNRSLSFHSNRSWISRENERRAIISHSNSLLSLARINYSAFSLFVDPCGSQHFH